MKKVFLLTLAAALLVVSCTKDETVSTPKQKAIGFSAFVNTPVKADPSTTTASLTAFDVYGFVANTTGATTSTQIFDGTTVSKGAESGAWSYTPLQYWVEGNTYTFGAIAPAGTVVANEALASGKVGMTVAFTNDGATDLLHAAPAAVAFTASSTGDPVAMTFAHQLAKAKFTFTNGVGASYSIKVKNIEITNAPKTATLTIAANGNTWGAYATDIVELAFGATDLIANEANAVSADEKLLIPNDNLAADVPYQYEVSFDTELYQGDVLLNTFSNTGVVEAKLQAGYAYNFAATLTAANIGGGDDELKPIQFTLAAVEAWDSAAAIDVTVDSAE